jgi:multisubunit Na+/H+ antiporter MnhB subunit
MKGMTVIVKTVTRWVKVFIVLYGIYITLTGHLTPGGGFAGGVIIACAYMLLTLAYGKEYALSKLKTQTASKLDCLGALLFLIVAVVGLVSSGVFFDNVLQKLLPGTNFRLLSAGVIPINNIAICLKVGAPLFAVFIIFSVIRVVTNEDGTKKMIQEEEEE